MRNSILNLFLSDEKGSILPITAFGMVILGGVAALVIDVGNLYALDNKLQSSADAAALAAISQVRGTPQEVQDAALEITAKNLPTQIHGAVLVSSDVELGEWDSDADIFTAGVTPPNAVRVTMRRTADNGNAAPVFFAHLMGIADADIVVEAIAAQAQAPTCLVSLRPNGTGIYVNSNSTILANGCSVHVNSTSSDAMETNSGSTVSAMEICIEGSYSGGGYSPAPDTNCDALDDPLAALMPPAAAGGSCDYNDRVINGGTATVYPGVYCGKLEVNGGTAFFSPGIYVLDDAEFIVNSGGSAIGDGVSIFLTGSDARLKFNSDSHVDLSAPVSGEMAGIIFYEDRSNPIGNEHLINSDSTSAFEGTVYLPRGRLTINSGAAANGASPVTAFIAYEFEINSNSSIEVNSDYEVSDVPVPRKLGPGMALRL